MKYIFDESYDKPLEDRILQLRNVSRNSLDITNFRIDYNLDVLNRFKDGLLSNKDKRFFIVGDYDCDGICATTIITKLFNDLGIPSNYYIPSRTKEGYGINTKIVDTAYNNNFDCLFCVDNGIVAKNELEYAKKLGLKTFIIDHHEYQEEPNCDYYLHPSVFPFEYKDMCAAGLCALLSNAIREDEFTTALGGLASLADMVEIFNYNRYLVCEMLDIVSRNVVMPINMLLGKNDISFESIQFNVIPKINAVSRLDDLMNVNYVVKFLLSKGQESFAYFDKIETINNARKDYSNQMSELARKLVNNNSNIIVIKDDSFKEGLCGLVANKILNEYKKPVIVFANTDGTLKGSGRSIQGVNLYKYLKNIEDIFESYGGHELAIGLSLKEDNFDKLIEYIENNPIEYEEPSCEVLLLEQDKIDINTLEIIDNLKPFSTGFNEPLFGLKNPSYIKKSVIANKYPKYEISESLCAISFNTNHLNKDFEYMIGRLSRDKYNQNKLCFLIEDLV